MDRRREEASQVMTRRLCMALVLASLVQDDDGDGLLKDRGRQRIFMDEIVTDDCNVNGNRLRSVAIRSGRNLTWQSMKPFRAQQV